MEITKQYNTRNRLIELVNNLQKMDAVIAKKETDIGFSRLDWVSPMSLLPLVVYAKNNGLNINYSGDDPGIMAYLDTINFPNGISDLTCASGGYLPITKLTCGLSNPLLSDYEDELLRLVSEKYKLSFTSGLKYLTSELQTNVEEHSGEDQFWIFAQYWPRTNTCEICIADTGKGYKESYTGTPHAVESDKHAITNAIKGISSKTPDVRGAGLPGIIKMFIEGYGGEMCIMSGNGLMHLNSMVPMIGNGPITWNGAVVGLTFKLKEIDIEKYY